MLEKLVKNSLASRPAAFVFAAEQRPTFWVLGELTISAALLSLVVLLVTFYLACLALVALERRPARRIAAVAA